jgi:alpha,alpha-trehalose phosphorylase
MRSPVTPADFDAVLFGLDDLLPTRAQRIRFPLRLGGSMLEVAIEPDLVPYTVRSGDPVTARHRGTEFTAKVGRPVTVPCDCRTHDAAIDAS